MGLTWMLLKLGSHKNMFSTSVQCKEVNSIFYNLRKKKWLCIWIILVETWYKCMTDENKWCHLNKDEIFITNKWKSKAGEKKGDITPSRNEPSKYWRYKKISVQNYIKQVSAVVSLQCPTLKSFWKRGNHISISALRIFDFQTSKGMEVTIYTRTLLTKYRIYNTIREN